MTQQNIAREFWVSDNVDDTVRKAKLTLKKLGELTAVVPGQYVVGTVACGLQHVSLKIAWRPEEVETKMDRLVAAHGSSPVKSLGTLLVMEASIDNHGTAGNESALQSALERFEEAYLHFDRADYKPDRLGLLPMTMIGILIVVSLLGFLLAKKTNAFKPAPMPSVTAQQ